MTGEISPGAAGRHKPVTFAKLGEAHCRYPLGDAIPGTAAFRFCGDQRMGDSPYCPYHHRCCYLPPDRR